MTHLPQVSVIVPCFEEGAFIRDCLSSIADNDYPKEQLEVLVVDGMSADGSREEIVALSHQYPFMKLVDNPKKITPAALNEGIKNARGEIILWMSAHNRYESDYIRKSVTALMSHEAQNVGGVIVTVPRKNTRIGRAIAKALSHPFGVGNSHFRTRPRESRWVDTVFGGCYWRSVFERIGLFNEKLTRGQDVEFNLRLKKSGGKILLIPEIVSYYYARSDMISFLKHNWTNGAWAILPFLYSRIVPVSWRHLVPLGFIVTLLSSTLLAFFSPWGMKSLFVVVGSYSLMNILASLKISLQERDWHYLFLMPPIFASLHLSYGLGSLAGFCKLLGARFSTATT